MHTSQTFICVYIDCGTSQFTCLICCHGRFRIPLNGNICMIFMYTQTERLIKNSQNRIDIKESKWWGWQWQWFRVQQSFKNLPQSPILSATQFGQLREHPIMLTQQIRRDILLLWQEVVPVPAEATPHRLLHVLFQPQPLQLDWRS